MVPLAAWLRRQGFLTVNAGYPSRTEEIHTLAHGCIPPAVSELRRQGAASIHFVTHSMGGILVRLYLGGTSLPDLGRVVMLSPPNQGSELVDYLLAYRLFQRLFGPAACQLGTKQASSLAGQLGPATFPVGIIMGDRSLGWLSARFFPGPNDGKVSVQRARLAGMADFLIVPFGHAFIMNHRQVKEQVVHFLRQGHFQR